jgi:hypothetical protein
VKDSLNNLFQNSEGYVLVYKALYIKSDKLNNSTYNKYYDEETKGYLLMWKCKYNTLTNAFHSTTFNHIDFINELPTALKDKPIYTIRFDNLDEFPLLSSNPEGLDNNILRSIGHKLSRGETNIN